MKPLESYAGGIVTALMVMLPGSHVLAEQLCTTADSDASSLPRLNDRASGSSTRFNVQQATISSLRACLVTPEVVMADQEHFTLVDVRTAAVVATSRIPQVLNLRLDDIGDSPFLPNDRDVVLIGDGSDTARMLRTCLEESDVKSAGVAVMDGGIRAWYRAGGELIGDTAALDQPWIVTSPVVGELAYFPGTWLLSDAVNASLEGLGDHHLNVADLSPQAAAQRLRARTSDDEPLTIILLLDGDQNLATWRQEFLSAGLPEPMFHRQGTSAYITWAQQQVSVNKQAGRTLGHGCRWN